MREILQKKRKNNFQFDNPQQKKPTKIMKTCKDTYVEILSTYNYKSLMIKKKQISKYVMIWSNT